MSHLNENIQGATPTAQGNITATLDDSSTLGHVLTNSNGQQGSGSGFYTASTASTDEYYLFFTGATSFSGIATVTSDSIILPKGTFFIECCPTFGQNNSTMGNTELRAQFVDENDNGLGNIGAVNRDILNCTFPAPALFSAYVEGPATVKLKITEVTANNQFPKNGSESNRSNFFLEIMRIK